MFTSGVDSSSAVYVKYALRLWLIASGFSRMVVSGSPGAAPRVQTMPKHWPGSMLPAARLLPPSIAPSGA
jgi:hypothetical protein